VDHHYWYQLYLDDLPIWGMVGEAGDEGKKVRAFAGSSLSVRPFVPAATVDKQKHLKSHP
jgi:hypothetical protein